VGDGEGVGSGVDGTSATTAADGLGAGTFAELPQPARATPSSSATDVLRAIRWGDDMDDDLGR
jgi:hypothetical protein